MTATVVLQRASRVNWLKHRRLGLGGTDVAAVFGVNPWATQLDVWLDKTGRAGERPDNYAMSRGRFMEDYLRGAYLANHPEARWEKPPALLAHPEYPMIRASLDGLVHHPDRTVLVEFKTAGWRQRADWWDDSLLIPDHYATQVLTYLAVTGLDEAHVVADIAGEYAELTIRRDLAWEAEALPLLANWWDTFVGADMPPPADWARDTIPALNRAWVPIPGTSVEATPSVAAAVRVWQALSPKQKDRTTTLENLRVQIREGMGTAQVLTIDGEKVANIDARGTLRVTSQKEIAA